MKYSWDQVWVDPIFLVKPFQDSHMNREGQPPIRILIGIANK